MMKNILFLFAILATSFVAVEAQNCAECEFVITFIEGWVENNSSITEIEDYLDVLCSTVFSSYEQTCEQLAEQGVDQVVAWIKADYTPEEVCTEMGMCTSEDNKIQKPIKQSLECEECDAVIGTIENWLDNTNNQDSVINAVEVVCTYMPGWEATCDSMIESGVPTVVSWIDTNENSTVVCNQLEMCGQGATLPAKAMKPLLNTKPVKNVGQGSDCSYCTMLVGYVESWAASNTSVADIETYLETICAYIPDYTQQCDQLIVAEVPTIVQSLEANESPQAICTQIGLCTSTKAVHKILNNKGHSKSIKKL